MKTIYVSYLLPLKATADLHDTASEVEIVDDIDGSTGYTIAHIMSSMRNNSECFVGMLNGSVCIDPATLSRKFNAYLVEAEPDVRESHASYAYKNLRPILYYHLNDRPFNFDEKLQDKWAGFIQLQKKFANIIASVYEDGDQIWIHDFPLVLLPALLRKRVPDSLIGFYLHSVFPSSEIFRNLSKRKEILEALLDASLIGFQAFSYMRHFLSSCSRILGADTTAATVSVGALNAKLCVLPYGPSQKDIKWLRPLADSNRSSFNTTGLKTIFAKESYDHLPGVMHKILAFEKFLCLYPEWADKVSLIQIIHGTKPEDNKLEIKVLENVTRINSTFGSLDFLPIKLIFQQLSTEEYSYFLTNADLALFISERDSLNIAVYEYIFAQQNSHQSPLIISEFSGIAGTLSTAFLVNPWDSHGIALVIHEAIQLSEAEKFMRHSILFNVVSNLSIDQWKKSFLQELEDISAKQSVHLKSDTLSSCIVKPFYENSVKRLFLLDYDGTLVGIKKVPEAAAPSEDLRKTLDLLCKDEKNIVYIVSGRDKMTLDNWLGDIHNLGFSAEHGCFIKPPHESDWTNLVEDVDLSWHPEVIQLLSYFTERTPGSFIEEKHVSIVWHYRLADQDFGTWQAKDCKNLLENTLLSKYPIELIFGKKNLEIRPALMNKGEVSNRIYSAYSPNIDFILSVGDDRTDEDMFQEINNLVGLGTTESTIASSDEVAESKKPTLIADLKATKFYGTCRIGPNSKESHANYVLKSPEELLALLATLVR